MGRYYLRNGELDGNYSLGSDVKVEVSRGLDEAVGGVIFEDSDVFENIGVDSNDSTGTYVDTDCRRVAFNTGLHAESEIGLELSRAGINGNRQLTAGRALAIEC